MKLQNNDQSRDLPRTLSGWTAAAALAALLALGVAPLGARSPSPSGGGDAIGSLPFNSTIPPESLVGAPGSPAHRPSIVLQGPDLDSIRQVIIDASGAGWAESFATSTGVRVELQGQVTLVLDRNRLQASPVTFGLDVSQGFSGGLGALTQQGAVVRLLELPFHGDLGIPLAELAASGALDHGGATLHSYNIEKLHHGLDLSGSGATLRLDSHE